MNYLFDQWVFPIIQLVTGSDNRLTEAASAVLIFKSPLFYLRIAWKHKSSDVHKLNIIFPCLIYKLNFVIGKYV